MHLIATYLIEIVFYTMSVRWKILVTLGISFRTHDFDDFDLLSLSFCLGGHEAIICKNREMMRLNRAAVWLTIAWPESRGPNQLTGVRISTWVTADWWALPLLSSNTTWHILQLRHLKYEIVEWTWLEVRVLSWRKEKIREREKRLD